MTVLNNAAVPTRPLSHWPVGMRLRFKPDAAMAAKHDALRGKPVIVLSTLRLIGPRLVTGEWSWRQQVLSMNNGCRVGWARPDQLELPADEIEG